ncbi:transposase [Savagea sp. SN6]|uniref:Transposase n=1 Tax=Savagea serpentis TaxID=2785297 RepID=A0A8J7GC51_9BACL|nr:transposase [Savagea serpentis]
MNGNKKAIYRHLQRLGYTGGYDAVKRLVREEKRKRNATTLQTFSVSRRKIIALLWKPQQEYLEEEHELLRHCISLAPPLQTFKSRVQQLYDALNDSTAKLFSKWVQDQLSDTTSPFYRYAQRIRSDLQAIQHSFSSPYSNGRLEGQINRLKTIKRMMYGRAGLKLLEKRILYRM